MAKVSVRINKELIDKIDLIEGVSRDSKVDTVIEKGLRQSNGSQFELDNQEKQQFFKHLLGGKGKEYQNDLMGLNLTERELIDLALSESGKTYSQLLREAVISTAKEQITLAARRKQQNDEGMGSPEKRLEDAFKELHDLMMEGRYRPRGGRLNISAVSQRSRVNFGTAKKWAELNQPELLGN